ncbi:MAG: sugar phosphate isomerase/epimerase family protein [Tunicatimonas sp.]
MSLDPGAIGVQVDQLALIKLAKQHGFEAVTPYPSFLVDHAQKAVTALQESSLVWGVAGLPVEFRQDEAQFERDLSALPRLAQALQEAGGARMSTWIMPTHAELNYLKNFQQHTDRLRRVAKVLSDHGVRLGLEYVGPKTLRDSQKYAFVSTLEETRALIAEIKQPNVGVVLDSFHWYTAEEAVDDILTLTNQEVVACDLNDAHRGRGPREQIDGERELPLATGIIPTKEFLQALVKINYDGPVRAEPFNQALNELDDQTAVANTPASLQQAFELIG